MTTLPPCQTHTWLYSRITDVLYIEYGTLTLI